MLRPTLPERENNTYFILPKAGEPPQAGAKPHARDMVTAINPAYLEFSKTRRTSFRPMNILLSIWGAGGLGFLAMLPMAVELDKCRQEWTGPSSCGYADSGDLPLDRHWSSSPPTASPSLPILLSKRLRRFYQWQGKQKGWTALDYRWCPSLPA